MENKQKNNRKTITISLDDHIIEKMRSYLEIEIEMLIKVIHTLELFYYGEHKTMTIVKTIDFYAEMDREQKVKKDDII